MSLIFYCMLLNLCSFEELDEKTVKTLKKFFNVFDKDKDGSVTTSELQLILENAGQKITESELKDFMKIYDTDHDGELSFDEFKAWWATLQ